MASLVNFALEHARQTMSGDVQFLQRYLYFFELRLPPEVARNAIQSDFLFPLVIPPESLTFSEPFAVEATPTQGGGLFVEENGIVQRTIALRGHTGWIPKAMQGSGPGALDALVPGNRTWSRSLPHRVWTKLSGQRHFQYLQDAVFRTYADLKQNPATSEGTQLYFHNPKDQESWRVVPQQFNLTRSVDKRTLYYYDIQLLAVERADARLLKADSEDVPILTAFQNALRCIQSGISLASGGINDLTAMVGELSATITGISSIIAGVTGILTAAQNFVAGVTTLILPPMASVHAMEELLDTAQQVASGGFVGQSLQNIQSGMHLMALQPQLFAETPGDFLQSRKNASTATLSVSSAAMAIALQAAPPQSMAGVDAFGTSLTPGEAQAAQGELNIQRKAPSYPGARQYVVQQGDTLANLAASFLGDARLWEQIAALNGLKPPFVNEQAAAATPGTRSSDPLLDAVLGIGEVILIPSATQATAQESARAVLGVRREESAAVHFLGRDIRLEQQPGGQWDVPIDPDTGDQDVKTVEGIDNLTQAMLSILNTERGTDILFKGVGFRRLVGIGLAEVNFEILRLRAREAIGADPRIATVRSVDITQPNDTGDQIDMSVVAEVRGFTEPLTVSATVGS